MRQAAGGSTNPLQHPEAKLLAGTSQLVPYGVASWTISQNTFPHFTRLWTRLADRVCVRSSVARLESAQSYVARALKFASDFLRR